MPPRDVDSHETLRQSPLLPQPLGKRGALLWVLVSRACVQNHATASDASPACGEHVQLETRSMHDRREDRVMNGHGLGVLQEPNTQRKSETSPEEREKETKAGFLCSSVATDRI